MIRFLNYIRSSNTKHLVAYYEETGQELDKALQIFIRMNDGGTPLSHSDLLLSIAVAQWTEHDARKEIHDLVDELNRVGTGFNFSKDLVLKAGLMLSDIGRSVSKWTTSTGRIWTRLRAIGKRSSGHSC